MSVQVGTQDQKWRDRASKVLPGMLPGHLNVTRYGMNSFPQWFVRQEGSKVYDVDGKAYVDMMCAYGPLVLGPNDPDVEKAVAAVRESGAVMTGPSPLMVELSEFLVDLIPHADWVMYNKNGTDATTTCVTIARAQTKKRKILVAKGAYHGAVPWCSPSIIGVTAEDRAHILYYEYNDVASLEAAVAEAKDDLAGIIASAFKHDLGKEHIMPTVEFAKRCRAICDQTGAALIVDDVRAGMRLHLGGSWELIGVQPDLSAWSKAIANGYALGFVTGNDKFRKGAAQIYVTGSFWCEALGFAACLATLKKLKKLNGPEYMKRMGQRLRDGIEKQAKERGIPIQQSGPPQMPVVLFQDDKFGEWKRGHLWTKVAMENGAYFHPTHTMFVSMQHTEADIDQALIASAAGMDAVAKEYGYKPKI